MYLVRTIFPEYVLGTYWYVLCLQKYCSGCCFMSFTCGKQYYLCVACMRWCSITKSVPLLVSNIHDFILVRTQYVLVCTCLYYYTFPVPVCTGYLLVLTASKQVRTKYPIPVMQFTIPDAGPVVLPPHGLVTVTVTVSASGIPTSSMYHTCMYLYVPCYSMVLI
jgi:hypothetical protein